MTTTNSQWFAERLADKHLSQRGLARLMGMDASAVSLMLRGKRKMNVSEAGEVAKFLGVHVDEVLRHAGVQIAPLSESPGRIRVTGWVDDERTVRFSDVPGPRVIDAPPGLPDGCQALRMQTEDASDGWVVFYRPTDGVSLEAMGRLCVVELESGVTALRVVRRGYEAGQWSLSVYGASRRSETGRLTWAAPVLWVKC